MTATWLTLAHDSYAAAGHLFAARRWRSVISRAYYAAYSRVAEALAAQGVAMPVGREGPSHKKVPVLVEDCLLNLRERRWFVSQMLQSLYSDRLAADYKPSNEVREADARKAMGMMVDLFRRMKETN